MVILVPVLAQSQVPESEQCEVNGGVLSFGDTGLHMRDGVDEGLTVKGEHQSNGAKPEEGGGTEGYTHEKRRADDQNLEPGEKLIPRNF